MRSVKKRLIFYYLLKDFLRRAFLTAQFSCRVWAYADTFSAFQAFARRKGSVVRADPFADTAMGAFLFIVHELRHTHPTLRVVTPFASEGTTL